MVTSLSAASYLEYFIPMGNDFACIVEDINSSKKFTGPLPPGKNMVLVLFFAFSLQRACSIINVVNM